MMKVLHIIPSSYWSGAEKVVYNLCYGFEKYSDKYEIEVVCGPYNGVLIEELKKININVYVLDELSSQSSSLTNLIKSVFTIRKIVKEGKYDIVHLHDHRAAVFGSLAAKTAGAKKTVCTIHSWWALYEKGKLSTKLLILAERFVSNFIDNIVFLSSLDLNQAKKWKIGKEQQYVIIPNAIIPPKQVEKGKLRKELGISEDVKIIGNVARLDRPKNPIRFLKIADKVLKQMENVVFVWIGGSVVEDEYGEYVSNFLESHPEYKGRLFFLGFRKDAMELMADFDVFLLT
ncbi:MAG: glycosyltransferase [Fervidobacterium pennivorans]